MEFKIGAFLTLEPIFPEKAGDLLKCKIVDKKEDVIYITYPVNMSTNKTVYLLDGSRYRGILQNGDRSIFAFQTEVIGRIMDRIPMIKLSCPPEDEFLKIERREFVRVKTPVDVAVEYGNQFYQCVANDISAGGVALKLPEALPFAEGNIVKLTIVLPFKNGDIQYIQTNARVIRIFYKDEQPLASFQYLDTDEVDQQQILRFCFERQVMMKEMLYLR
ncbi:PilZ domain-containing protein [Ureibacillus sp. FSL K6-8385]|uniref:flagellar brake protein n=1 Tax=Ureibacillus sp. FSL K6-8385 TaxID=2954684 RepID=UPI0031582FE0